MVVVVVVVGDGCGALYIVAIPLGVDVVVLLREAALEEQQSLLLLLLL